MRYVSSIALIAVLLSSSAAIAENAASACATAQPTVRTGKRIQDELTLMGYTISATQVAQLHHFEKADVTYPTASWCVESRLTHNSDTYTFWHNAAADAANASGPFDRVTRGDRSPENGVGNVTLIADRHAASMHQDGDLPAIPVVYDVVLESEGTITFLGSYDGPLTPKDLAIFAAGGAVAINANIDKKAHKVTLYRMQ